jgi:hypothetical protein
MDAREKRELREHKREVKRRGNKHRRQQLKRALRENPEEAHLARPTVGRFRSAQFNGLDQRPPEAMGLDAAS